MILCLRCDDPSFIQSSCTKQEHKNTKNKNKKSLEVDFDLELIIVFVLGLGSNYGLGDNLGHNLESICRFGIICCLKGISKYI